MYYELDFLEPALKSVKEIEDAFECVVGWEKLSLFQLWLLEN